MTITDFPQSIDPSGVKELSMFHSPIVRCLLCVAACLFLTKSTSGGGLDGEWAQYVLQPNGEWDDLCAAKFLLQRTPRGDYNAKTLWLNPIFRIKQAVTSGHRLNEPMWTFKSNWGGNRIAEFRLKRVSEHVFIGWSYERGQRAKQSVWVRRPQKMGIPDR